MPTPSIPSCVEVFTEHVLIRRSDGTIASRLSIEQLGVEVASARAKDLAKKLDLAGQSRPRRAVSRLAGKLPNPTIVIKSRVRSSSPRRYSTHLSVRLCIVSTGTGSNRTHRWATAGVGEAGKITQDAIDRAWLKVYSQWAWGGHMRDRYGAAEVIDMPIPERLDQYLRLIRPPAAPRVQELLDSIGYDPDTGSDFKAREKRRIELTRRYSRPAQK